MPTLNDETTSTVSKSLQKTIRIKFMSDLHHEFGSNNFDHYSYLTELYDIFIIAGDASNCDSIDEIVRLADAISPKPLLYVTGNHDYYGSDRGTIDDAFDNLQDEVFNFFFLNHAIIDLGDHVVIGCTGWQNLKEFSKETYPLNDFIRIKDHAKSIAFWGRDDRKFLREALTEVQDSGKKVIVVTHVPPCVESIDTTQGEGEKRKWDGLLKAYHNNYRALIRQFKPDLWLCGHMHNSIDKMVDDTRVVRNAYGYHTGSNRKNNEFNEQLIIEV